jgi:hypothetical protein
MAPKGFSAEDGLEALILSPMIGLWPAIRLAYPPLHSAPEPPSIAWDATRSVAGLWLLSPVFTIVFGCLVSFSGNPNVRFALGELALPSAAWIGSRYGQSGFRFIAMIFLPLLIGLQVNLFEDRYAEAALFAGNPLDRRAD